VKEFLGKQEHVKVAYLFGSYAQGREGPLSDVDIAVLLDERLSKSERFDLMLKLITKISAILGIREADRLDVVVMNDSPLVLNYNIIKDGKIILCKDELTRARFEFETMRRRLDMEYYDMRHAKIGIERIAKEGIL